MKQYKEWIVGMWTHPRAAKDDRQLKFYKKIITLWFRTAKKMIGPLIWQRMMFRFG